MSITDQVDIDLRELRAAADTYGYDHLREIANRYEVIAGAYLTLLNREIYKEPTP